MTNINVAHIKCRVDCTKPLPQFGELERENGEIVTVSIEYPWVPPICVCCSELGHMESHCPSGKWKAKQPTHQSPPENQAPPPPTAASGGTSGSDNPVEPQAPLVADAPSTLVANFEIVAPLSSNDPQSTAPTSSSSPSLQFPQPFIPTSSPPSSALAPDDSCESSVAMVLDPDGSLATPPSSPLPLQATSPSSSLSPPVDSPNPFSHISSDSYPPPSSAITHLLALSAYHHPRPVKTSSFKKANPCLPFESKFLVSPNPFACLAKEPIPPLDPPVDPCSPSLPAPILPDVGSLLPARENPTF